jgi:hypothetical protein
MTGRALGYCNGYDSPGFTRGVPRGRGFGFRRGFGRGWGRGFWQRRSYPYYEPAPYYPGAYLEPRGEEEKSHLENLVKDLEEELKAVRDRIQELSKEKSKEK